MQDYVSEQYVNKDIGLELVSNPISIQKRKDNEIKTELQQSSHDCFIFKVEGNHSCR